MRKLMIILSIFLITGCFNFGGQKLSIEERSLAILQKASNGELEEAKKMIDDAQAT